MRARLHSRAGQTSPAPRYAGPGWVARSSCISQTMAAAAESPHMSCEGCSCRQTAGRDV